MNDLTTLPAFMGYSVDQRRGGFIVRCCAYCATKAEVDAVAVARGMAISHGICPACYAVESGKITGSK